MEATKKISIREHLDDLLLMAAHGQTADPDDVDRFADDLTRDDVREAVARVVALHAAGAQADARREARRSVDEICHMLARPASGVDIDRPSIEVPDVRPPMEAILRL